MSKGRWLFRDFFWFYRNPTHALLQLPRHFFLKWTKEWRSGHSCSYLKKEGVLTLLGRVADEEIEPVYCDLAFLHRQVRRRRPTCILEFGIGFSTLVMAHALMLNVRDGKSKANKTRRALPQLVSVDANDRWVANTKAKLPDELIPFVTFWHSNCDVAEIDGEFCHLYTCLPNVVPNFVYIDGPDPLDVNGKHRGLGFTLEDGRPRDAMAADLLLYESSLQRGAFIVIDGRKSNTRFLRRRLKRRYRFLPNRIDNRYTFDLLD